MPGYPCCCRQSPNCGACEGTAPAQYQLTVPEGVFIGGSCDEACAEFNGVYLLDYDPALTYQTFPEVTCIWESPAFEGCYGCSPADPGEGIPAMCSDVGWRWRIELVDDTSAPGDVIAYVFLYSLSLSFSYMWTGVFNGNCSETIYLTSHPTFRQIPSPGCAVNDSIQLTLEVPS